MKQFLVIQTAFLGDAVLATALLEKLHAHYPQAAIDVVVRNGNEGLFVHHPFVRNLFVWNKRRDKTRNLLRLIGDLRRTRYDHIINCQRFFSTGLMTVLARGGEKIGYSKNPLSFLFTRKVVHEIPEPKAIRSAAAVLRQAQDDSLVGPNRERPLAAADSWQAQDDSSSVHEVDRLNALIAHLTDASRPLPRLHPNADERQRAAFLIDQYTDGEGRFVCIAPASAWHTKQWPAAKWIALVNTLPQDLQVLYIGGPGDRALCDAIARASRGESLLNDDLSLLETAAVMERAEMNYVNDSAPLHIASAMNAPVTAVFCSTVPAFGFGPLHANGRVAQIDRPLPCRPCGLHGYKVCPQGHFRCALDITVEQVAAR